MKRKSHPRSKHRTAKSVLRLPDLARSSVWITSRKSVSLRASILEGGGLEQRNPVEIALNRTSAIGVDIGGWTGSKLLSLARSRNDRRHLGDVGLGSSTARW